MCVRVCMCACVGVWASGRLGVWVSGVWVTGCLGGWVGGWFFFVLVDWWFWDVIRHMWAQMVRDHARSWHAFRGETFDGTVGFLCA